MKRLIIALLLGMITITANAQYLTTMQNKKTIDSLNKELRLSKWRENRDSIDIATLKTQVSSIAKDVSTLKSYYGQLTPDSTIAIDTTKKTFGVNQSKLAAINSAISTITDAVKKVPYVDVTKLQNYYDYIDRLKGYNLTINGNAILPK